MVTSMHERKALMFEAADAFITIPGGGRGQQVVPQLLADCCVRTTCHALPTAQLPVWPAHVLPARTCPPASLPDPLLTLPYLPPFACNFPRPACPPCVPAAQGLAPWMRRWRSPPGSSWASTPSPWACSTSTASSTSCWPSWTTQLQRWAAAVAAAAAAAAAGGWGLAY